jgi:hypothetical protein
MDADVYENAGSYLDYLQRTFLRLRTGWRDKPQCRQDWDKDPLQEWADAPEDMAAAAGVRPTGEVRRMPSHLRRISKC